MKGSSRFCMREPIYDSQCELCITLLAGKRIEGRCQFPMQSFTGNCSNTGSLESSTKQLKGLPG
jgi:hypothetical protein